ncbi:MAG: NAD(P)-dependent alcohol dehydrogenase [Candidatus Bathyarchaeia archaeon]|jgi:NADPH:quinone reductase-like Zn-dependent oxidoreductase
MKAIVYTKYGSPDVLRLEEVEKPTPKEDEVLVEVHAASVNDWDWGLLRGKPFVNRLLFGLRKPKVKILGCDIAGRVEAVGRNVKQFQPGDEVFGDISGCGMGGFAEYVCARENVLAPKSASMTYEQAAAVPQAAVLALQGLRKGQIQPGQKVLINGAGGGVGTFGMQIAKSFGAEVTGVDSTGKLDMVRSIGADQVIDYTKEDFTKSGRRYDLILDVVVYRSILDYKRALSPKGIFVMIGGSIPRVFLIALTAPLITRSKKLVILAHKPNSKDLIFMNNLFEAGKVAPVIDRRYPLSEVPEALRYFGKGHVQGKVVITVR